MPRFRYSVSWQPDGSRDERLEDLGAGSNQPQNHLNWRRSYQRSSQWPKSASETYWIPSVLTSRGSVEFAASVWLEDKERKSSLDRGEHRTRRTSHHHSLVLSQNLRATPLLERCVRIGRGWADATACERDAFELRGCAGSWHIKDNYSRILCVIAGARTR
jgi:hypothetical protein